MSCATAPQTKVAPENSEVLSLLSQAASQFQAPNPPKSLNLMDQAQVEWKLNKSMKVTVHQIWAARVKPDRPLPPLSSLNQESEDLTVQSLQLYELDEKGAFGKATKAEMRFIPPEPNLPPSLSKITSVQLPELNAGQALEVAYTLETKTDTLLADKDIQKNPKEAQKPHPVAPEASFAFRWNDYVPSLKRELTVKSPTSLPLYATRLRIPKNLTITEDKTLKDTTVHFSLDGSLDPVPLESFQPALQDLAPLTAFTPYKSWEEAVFPYRIRMKKLLEQDLAPLYELTGEAIGNTAEATLDKVIQLKTAIHQKVQWVDTGLPVYLNPDRAVSEVLESGKGTSHDLAILLALAMKSLKIPTQIYLYRQATSGELVPDLPALSQLDGVLIAAQIGKDWVWMDPTESLAAPGQLPLSALGQQALAVLAPLQWKTTPSFTAKDHRKERDVNMEFLSNGNLKCTVALQAFGSSDLALRQFFRMTTDESRREMVLKGLSRRFPGANLTDYQFTDYRDISKPLNVTYTFEVPDFGETDSNGDFVFYPMVFEDVEDFLANLRDNRKTPVVISQNFNSTTRVLVKLPRGFQVKQLPKDSSFSNSIAEFISNTKTQFGTLSYERYVGLKQRVISPGKEYEDLLTFYQAVLNQDRAPFKANRLNQKP